MLGRTLAPAVYVLDTARYRRRLGFAWASTYSRFYFGAGSTDQSGVRIDDEPRRDGFHEGRESPFRLESLPEVAPAQMGFDLRGDSAGDEHPAAGTQGQREVACDRPEDRAEPRQGGL